MTSIAGHNSSKINTLLKAWPHGTVAVQSWLNDHGVYRQLADSYCKYGWLERIGSGAYIKSGEGLSVLGAVYAMQEEMELKLHVGAETALEMSGVGHYATLDQQQSFWIFVNNSNGSQRVPSWFKNGFLEKYNAQVKHTNLFGDKWDLGLEKISQGTFSISISSMERAIMECIYLAPDNLSLEYVYTLMEKLRTLRAELCLELLLYCNSVKVKRLFLYLAEISNHGWFKLIDKTKIDLGRGSRQITPNGVYISEYKIVVPDLKKHEGYESY